MLKLVKRSKYLKPVDIAYGYGSGQEKLLALVDSRKVSKRRVLRRIKQLKAQRVALKNATFAQRYGVASSTLKSCINEATKDAISRGATTDIFSLDAMVSGDFEAKMAAQGYMIC